MVRRAERWGAIGECLSLFFLGRSVLGAVFAILRRQRTRLGEEISEADEKNDDEEGGQRPPADVMARFCSDVQIEVGF
jgi:hypothetical protein